MLEIFSKKNMILGYTVVFHILQQRFMQLQELLEPIGAFVPVRMFQLKVRFFYQEGRVQIPLHSMSADLHYNVLDPDRNVSPPPEIGHKKCPDFSRQKESTCLYDKCFPQSLF